MSKWIHTTLNDICRSDKGAIISGPFGSNISSKFFVLDGVPVIRGNNLSLSLDKFYDDDFVFVTEEKADELNCYAEEGDLIFTAAGTIGQVGILEAPLKYKKYVISNKQLRARIDTRKVDLLYAYYWFASAWMQNYFIRNNKGSTVPLITLSELKDAPISYPEDITEQKKIAMAIEAISRKINNNRNICFNLESMAKTLYDYWFTQFNVQFYLQQISQVIEKIGYMQAKQNDLTIFVEKDPAAIAVAEGEFIPESLSYRLISYNHYSMKGNLAEKKTTLLDLANLLEPQRTILERIDKTFSSDLFYTFNNFHIRHNNIDQLGTKYKKPVGDLSDEQLEYWYDEVYQMCLLAFMRLEHIDRKKKFDSLKSQIEGT